MNSAGLVHFHLSRAPSPNAAVAILCVYVFGLGAWLANQHAFKQDIARGRIATVVGFVETILSAFLVDKIGAIARQTGGFGAVFVVFASLFTFALVVVFILMRERWIPEP